MLSSDLIVQVEHQQVTWQSRCQGELWPCKNHMRLKEVVSVGITELCTFFSISHFLCSTETKKAMDNFLIGQSRFSLG